MTLREFEECVNKIKNNVDKFIKESQENEILLMRYIQLSEQITDKLKKQLQDIEMYQENRIEEYQKHLQENKRYLISDVAMEIEDKLKLYDEMLKKRIEEKERLQEEIRKLNKKG